MRDEVQAENNKKLGNLLASMSEKAFKHDNHAQKESIEPDEQEQTFLKKNSRKLQDLASQISGESPSD